MLLMDEQIKNNIQETAKIIIINEEELLKIKSQQLDINSKLKQENILLQ